MQPALIWGGCTRANAAKGQADEGALAEVTSVHDGNEPALERGEEPCANESLGGQEESPDNQSEENESKQEDDLQEDDRENQNNVFINDKDEVQEKFIVTKIQEDGGLTSEINTPADLSCLKNPTTAII
ncbi:MAG TPA: hypothetical protein GXX17_01575 [Clostridiales bacterium]|nr:hypothetical protein [Clostridiales bacterium]